MVVKSVSLQHSSVLPASSRKEDILVASDLHLGAPYADRERAEAMLAKELSDERTKICVLLGDIYEGVNLPIKDLPKTPEEAAQRRIDLVADYAKGKRIELSRERRDRIPAMSRDELDRLLRDIDEESSLSERLLPSRLRGAKLDAQRRDPSGLADTILRQSQTQELALIETFDQHMEHLEQLVLSHPRVKFHYVIGNHERMPAFIAAVNALSDRLGNERLKIWQDYVKIGDGLFIHGDQQLDPKKYHIDKPTMYDESYVELNRAFALQVIHDVGNKIVPEVLLSDSLHTPANCALKIMRWFAQNDPEALRGVKHIFSGHTHCKYDNLSFVYPAGGEEYTFHNTGASISRFKGLNETAFNPLRVTVDVKPQEEILPDPHAYLEGGVIETPVRRVMQSRQAAGMSR